MENVKKRIPWRHEIKYVCSEAQIPVIRNRVSVFCDMDRHAGPDGRYHVRSLYFDDYSDTAYYENEMGVDPRQKYRIRLYNGNADFLVLERKAKRNGKTFKESTPFSRERCREILRGDWLCEDLDREPTLIRQFYMEYRTKLLRPKVIVEYERIPYVYPTGNVRITFDRNISASGDVSGFLEQDLPARPIMPQGQHVLEVKYDALIPDVIYNAVSGEKLRQTAYSKYYLSRKIDGGR